MPFKKPRFSAVFWTLIVLLGGAVVWFTGNLLYSVLWAVLADWGVPLTEAKIVAYIIANLAPFALILVLGLILFLVIRRHLSKATEAEPQTFFDIARDVYRESYRIDDGGALELWENVYCLVVGNGRPNGLTLRKVSASLRFMGPPIQCPLKDDESAFTTDIKHGELAYFRVGKVVTSKIDGIPVLTAKPAISKERKEVYQHNISLGHLSFEPGTTNIGFSSGFGPDKSVWKFQLVVSADDVGARTISLQVDLRFAPAKIELKL